MTKSIAPIRNFYASGVSVSVFSNENVAKNGEKFLAYSVSISRSYKNGDKTEYTNSLGEFDLAITHALILRAMFFIQEQREKMNK